MVYGVRLVNDGNSSLQAMTFTLSDLSTATGIGADSFSHLSIYKSDDAHFDAGSDSLAGTQSIVNLGAPTTIPLTTPLTWYSGFPYFLVVATLNSIHIDEPNGAKDAFRVDSASGAIQTSSGNIGNPITASDDDQIKIDVIAIQTAFATLPTTPDASNDDIVSGKPFDTQPILEARNDAGIRDLHYQGNPLSLSVLSGDSNLSGTTTKYWNNGQAAFDVPNGDTLSGVAFQTQPIVEALNASGALDLHFQDPIALTAHTDTLSGTAAIQTQAGRATFTDLTHIAPPTRRSFSSGPPTNQPAPTMNCPQRPVTHEPPMSSLPKPPSSLCPPTPIPTMAISSQEHPSTPNPYSKPRTTPDSAISTSAALPPFRWRRAI